MPCRRDAGRGARTGACGRNRQERGGQVVRPGDLGHRTASRTRLPHRLQPAAQPGVEGAMSRQNASIAATPIAVTPGKVSLCDLADALAGTPVVLDPSFWPRVEASSRIV